MTSTRGIRSTRGRRRSPFGHQLIYGVRVGRRKPAGATPLAPSGELEIGHGGKVARRLQRLVRRQLALVLVHSLDSVAVGVHDEGGVIGGPVVRSEPSRAVVRGTESKSGGMKRVDCLS